MGGDSLDSDGAKKAPVNPKTSMKVRGKTTSSKSSKKGKVSDKKISGKSELPSDKSPSVSKRPSPDSKKSMYGKSKSIVKKTQSTSGKDSLKSVSNKVPNTSSNPVKKGTSSSMKTSDKDGTKKSQSKTPAKTTQKTGQNKKKKKTSTKTSKNTATKSSTRPKKKKSSSSGSSKTRTPSKSTLRVSNQIPKERRDKIEKSLSKAKGKKRRDWDRAKGAKQHLIAKKRVKPGTIRQISLPLLDVTLGESWMTPVTVIHGARPGPVVTVTGAVHGDELVGPLACSMLCQDSMTGIGRALDPLAMAGTVRIVPILNPPGFNRHSRYFPDGRDLNRQFPGSATGNTTSRVADTIWENLIVSSDYLLDLHAAARGRTNLPQVRANLAHPESNKVARAFGVEVVLDSKGPRGTMRRTATDEGVGALTYEGGGATLTDHEVVKVAVYGVLNVLRSLKVIPGYPSRPRFRLLASGSTWIRAEEGGLVDMFVQSGSFVEEGDIIGRIVDPHKLGMSADILSPERGLLICSATNPFVTAGTPVGHLLPINRGVKLVKSQLDDHNRLIVSGSVADPPWREEFEVDEISIEGNWQGGDVDSEWQREWTEFGSSSLGATAEEEDGSEE